MSLLGGALVSPGTNRPDTAPSRTPRRARLTVFFAAWSVLFALSGLWAIATPPSASPDEPAHIVKAASVVRGEFIGTPSPHGHIVTVPRYIAESQSVTCFAFNATVTADCPALPPADPWQNVRAPTSAGLYNPVYYAIVGWPSLLIHDSSGIYAMRLVSALFATLFAALGFGIVATLPFRRLPILAFAVAATPMLVFLSGSVNPSAVEATATLAVFCGVLAIVSSPDDALLTGRVAVVMAASVVAIDSRGLSPLWVLVALLVPLLLADRAEVRRLLRTRAIRLLLAVVAAATLAAGAWTLGSDSLANAIAHPGQALSFPDVGASPLAGFQKVLVGTVGYSQGLVGVFGWLDTPAPDIVLYGWGVAIGALAAGALVVLRGRRLLVSAALISAFLLLPAVVQAAYIHGGGMIWQGRYNLPLFLCLVIGLAVMLGDTAFQRSERSWRRIGVVVALGAAGGQLWSFATALRRYAVGADGSTATLLFGTPAWVPPGGILPILLAFAATAVVGAVLLLRATNPLPALAPAPVLRPAGTDLG